MRISLVSVRDTTADPLARRLAWWLEKVGHQVSTVHPGVADPAWPGRDVAVAWRVPQGLGPVGAILRRLQPPPWRIAERSRRVGAAASAPEIVYPVASQDIPAALRAGGAVCSPPEWRPRPPRDIAWLAPSDRRLSTSPAGEGVDHHLPGWTKPGSVPQAGRHAGATLVMVHRMTSTTPGRYLTAAMERAGIEVLPMGTDLNWDQVPDNAAGVVIVESPLPRVTQTGTRKPIPMLFWVHHGEHHLATNLRLVQAYGPDAVLLAHSWHLAHRFPVPVHRFPFAVAPELYADPLRFDERRYAISMVGVGLRAIAGRYNTRGKMVAELEAEFGERSCFPADRVEPEELARIYSESRIVLNDGGTRHFPITMRVFEAIGAGALLLTEDAPGIDLLFPRDQYAVLSGPTVDQVADLLDDPHSSQRAQDAYQHARLHHTYDHRVDELLDILRVTTPQPPISHERPSEDELIRYVRDDVDVDTIIEVGEAGVGEALPDRAVWPFAAEGRGSRIGRVDAAVITGGTSADIDLAVAAARRFVYSTPGVSEDVERSLDRHHPEARVTSRTHILRADLGFEGGYRLAATAEEPGT